MLRFQFYFFTRITTEDDLEDLSCTDIAQQWGKLKSCVQKDFEAVPLIEFCHVTKPSSVYATVNLDISEELCKKFFEDIVISKYMMFFALGIIANLVFQLY